MVSQPQEADHHKAYWDERNTGMFLQILIEEIDMGNKLGGHFRRPTWARIAKKFANLSGDNYTITQLKNKYDNMKKEFGMWEKLLNEESGLGYDHKTGRITADPIWWKNKLKEKPEYKQFRTSGPTHPDLKERVFRGMVATGYMKYIPAKYRSKEALIDPQCNEQGSPSTHYVTEPLEGHDFGDATTTAPVNALPLQTLDGKSKDVRKRKRSSTPSSTPSSKPTEADSNQKMSEQSVNNDVILEVGEARGYTTAIRMLRSLPWLKPQDPLFIPAVALLQDPLKRVALASIIDLGEEVIRNYLGMFIKK